MTGGPSSSSWSPNTPQPEASAEVCAYLASRWDEEVCLGLQEEEIASWQAAGHGEEEAAYLAPIPENLPLPIFGVSETLPETEAGPQGDWLEALQDARSLRGKAREEHGRPPHGRDPSTLTSPSCSSRSPPTSDTQAGVTQRGSKTRVGVDRWHHPDGSIRNRRQEQLRLSNQPAPSSSSPMAGDHATVDATASKEEAKPKNCSSLAGENTTTAGETVTTVNNSSTTGADDAQAGPSSNSSASSSVGFWAHGVWHPRERTPAEQKQHRGGMGPQRTQRKLDRMNAYWAGKWKPAWLVKYIDEKAQRQQFTAVSSPSDGPGVTFPQAAPASTTATVSCVWGDSVSDGVNFAAAEPSDLTDVDPWSGQWQNWTGSSWWDTWSWDTHYSGETWTWTTSSTTSVGDLYDFPPNFGLFPVVTPVTLPAATPVAPEVEEALFMQLTGAERQTLRENGVPTEAITRVADLLDRLDDHNSFETGPEARWALCRLVQRAEDGVQCLEAILEILHRRLRPRGYLPVVRVPRQEADRMRFFTWVRQYTTLFVTSLERHLSIMLQPVEGIDSPPPPYDQVRPNPADSAIVRQAEALRSEAVASSSTTAAMGSNVGTEEDQEAASSSSSSASPSVAVRLRSRSPVRGSTGTGPAEVATANSLEYTPGEEVQQALAGDLMGVWREPTSSTTTSMVTTTTVVVTPLLQSGSTLSSALPTTTWTWTTSCTTSWPTRNSSSVSTTTTSSSSAPTSMDVIRDAVSQDLWHGNDADVIDLLRRLLDRQRVLNRYQAHVTVALEECLTWLRRSRHGLALNAATMESRLWGVIGRETATGDVTSALGCTGLAEPHVALLHPGFPLNLDDVANILPGVEPTAVAGLRRRAWRAHVATLHQAAGRAVPSGRWPAEDDRDLFLVQTNADEELANFPTDQTRPPDPLRQRQVEGVAARRRGQRFRRRRGYGVVGMPVRRVSVSGALSSSEAPGQDPGVAAAHGRRERSRSRDGEVDAHAGDPGEDEDAAADMGDHEDDDSEADLAREARVRDGRRQGRDSPPERHEPHAPNELS